MDTTNALSEPLLQLQGFHQTFNVQVKVATVGLVRLRKSAEDDANFGSTFRQEVKLADPLWGPFLPMNMTRAIDDAIDAHARLGVLATFAAFEDFLISVEGESMRWRRSPSAEPTRDRKRSDDRCPTCKRPGFRPPRAAGDSDGDDDSAVKLVRRLGYEVGALGDDAAVLRYFRELRNCVAHRGGRASRSLAECSTSAELEACTARWPVSLRAQKRKRRPPPLPKFQEHEPIHLQPRHAVLASAVCWRLAAAIDRALLQELGAPGLAWMGVREALIEHPERWRKKADKSPVAPIHRALYERYGVRGLSEAATITALRGADRWEATKAAFAQSSPKS